MILVTFLIPAAFFLCRRNLNRPKNSLQIENSKNAPNPTTTKHLELKTEKLCVLRFRLNNSKCGYFFETILG